MNESWDRDAEARLTARAIEARIQKFHQTVTRQAGEFSKDTGFLSLQTSSGQSLSSPLNLPASSPSCSSSLTISHSDYKPPDCYSSQGLVYSPPPPNMELCEEMPQNNTLHPLSSRVPNGRPWSHGDLNPNFRMLDSYDPGDQLPPYQQRQQHQPLQLHQLQRPVNVHSLPHLETTI